MVRARMCLCLRSKHRRSTLSDREMVGMSTRPNGFNELPVYFPRLLSPFLQAEEMCACEAANKQWHTQFTLLWQHLAEGRWGQNAVARFVEGTSTESEMADILPPRESSRLRKDSWKVTYLEMNRRIWTPDTELGPNLVC